MNRKEFKEALSKYDLKISDIIIKDNRELVYVISDKLSTERDQKDVLNRFFNFIKDNDLFHSTIKISEIYTLYGPYSLSFSITLHLEDDYEIIEEVRKILVKNL